MRKILFTVFTLFILCISESFAETDWEELYLKAEYSPVKLMNGIDPYQDEDNYKYAYTAYPLFRTSVWLYFKDYKIAPGYYQLTARKMGDRYYVFFKDNGKVKFMIPVVKREFIPSVFYKKYIPKQKLTGWQKFGKGWEKFWARVFRSTGKIPPPASFIEIEDKDAYFVLKLYFDEHCYYTVYKRVPF